MYNVIHPYWSILKDSFREALASRVLWVMLILITIALVAIAPFHITSVFSSNLTSDDLIDPTAFVRTLVSAADTGAAAESSPETDRKTAADSDSKKGPDEAKTLESKRTPVARIWSQLATDELRESLRGYDSLSDNKKAETLRTLRGDINKQLKRSDFYDAAYWPTPPSETSTAGELLKKGVGQLSNVEVQQLNRRLFEAEFRGQIRRAPDRAGQVRYAVWDVGPNQPRPTLELIIRGVLTPVLGLIVGTIGVFVGILVTSGIVPQTFEPGSIDLLFSKPVSRGLVYLTKVVGGSLFIAICSLYFTAGLWLIMGVQFGLWLHNLWMCIPVYQFLFLIYYSVSSLAGVIWRSPIISVMVTIFFWITCFTVGTVKAVFDAAILDPTRVVRVTLADNVPIVVQASGETRQWGGENDPNWLEIARSDSQRNRGPFSEVETTGFEYIPTRGLLVQMEEQRGGPPRGRGERLVVGRRVPEWKRIDSVPPPSGALSLFVTPQERVLVVTVNGIYQLKGSLWSEKTEPLKVFGMKLPFGDSKSGAFENIGPDSVDEWERPLSAALDSSTGQIAVQTGSRLRFLKPEGDKKYTEFKILDLGENKRSLVGFAKGRAVVADETGRVRVFSMETLETQLDIKPFGAGTPSYVAASADTGWFAVLSSHRRVWLFDPANNRDASTSIAGQGDISAVEFLPNGRLLVADRYRRVLDYSLAATSSNAVSVTSRFEPAPTTQELIYWYVTKPIYTVFPKPSELDNLVSYLITDSTDPVAQFQQDLREKRPVVDIWQPVYSCTAFLIFVLLCGCVYVARRDF